MENELLNKIVKILDEKKAIDVKTIDIKEKSSLADYMVVASGTSITHIKALADNVEEELKKENTDTVTKLENEKNFEELKKENILPHKIEGYNSNSWILMDYLDVIVNIFTETDREHYKLEDLWEKLN